MKAEVTMEIERDVAREEEGHYEVWRIIHIIVKGDVEYGCCSVYTVKNLEVTSEATGEPVVITIGEQFNAEDLLIDQAKNLLLKEALDEMRRAGRECLQ